MRKYFIVLLLLFPFMQSYAQSWYRNYEKYWWYRYRLVNDFMKVGDNYGESIPAYLRVIGNNNGGPGYLHWGDATQALGHYLVVTATEHKILEANGWNTNRAALENYYAQNAFERVDKYAETYCGNIDGTYPNNGSPGSNDQNGFFIRDDVQEDFVINNFQHFNRPKIISHIPVGNFTATNVSNYLVGGSSNPSCYSGFSMQVPGGVVSDYSVRKRVGNYLGTNYWGMLYCPPSIVPSGLGAPPRYPVEESQDQLSEIMIGMALSTRYMASASFNGQNLQEKAADNAFRAASWAGHSPNAWIIKNPLNNHCVYGVETNQYFSPNGCLASGGTMMQASPGIAKATDIIVGSYHNVSSLLASASGFQPIFQVSQLIASGNAMFQDNYVAIARNWYTLYLPWPFNGFVNTSWNRIKKHALNNDFQTPHIPLIYRIYNSGGGVGFDPSDDGQPTYEKLLNTSTFCGNFAYNNNPWSDSTVWDWKTQDRLGFADKRPDNGANADFNGVDYMELFNLYALVKQDYLQWIINPYYQENYNINYPDANGYGSNTNWLTLNYLEYLSLINKINSNAHITFRGAKAIDILPGFDISSGAVFTAYIEDYDCRQDGYHYATLAPNGTNDHPIEYNPTGQVYQPMVIAPSQEAYEDSVVDALMTPEIEQAMNDSLMAKLQNSEYYELMQQLYPELFNTQANNARYILAGNDSENIKLYPNPNAGNFTILFAKKGQYHIRVNNMIGTELYAKNMECTDGFNIAVNLPNAPSGNYIVEVTSRAIHFIQKITIIK